MEILKKTPSGNLFINEKAICDIASIATSKIKDVYPNKKDGKFVKLTHKEELIDLEIFVKLKQGEDINLLCGKIQENVYDNVYSMTDIKLNNIDINIQGFVQE